MEIFKNKKNIILALLVSLLVVCICIFTVVSINTSAVSKQSDPQIFEVVEGDNLNTILQRLEENGHIKNASFAKLTAKISGVDGFIAGVFKIDRNWDANTILKHFTHQSNVVIDEVMITFREGIWAKDIAKTLENKLGVEANELIALWNDDNFLKACINKYDFLTEDILNSQYRVKLEGYLFPETYSFAKDATLEEITYTFLNHFQSIYDTSIKGNNLKGFTLHELVTLASVVQYEASNSKDMKMIAGVFLNRLEQNMALQSSVTVCYSMYEFDNWESCETNIDINSPYNTYQHSGLPVGPILNPGKEALVAVLNPESHEYLYFIADIYNVKKEGEGKVFYSKTLDEHLTLQNELNLMW